MKLSEDSKDVKLIKSKEFAIEIIKTCKVARKNGAEYSLVDQLIRSATSVGANLRESIYAQSSADFLSKCSIALKEAEESCYWLELLYELDYIDEVVFRGLYRKGKELVKILTAILNTSKQK